MHHQNTHPQSTKLCLGEEGEEKIISYRHIACSVRNSAIIVSSINFCSTTEGNHRYCAILSGSELCKTGKPFIFHNNACFLQQEQFKYSIFCPHLLEIESEIITMTMSSTKSNKPNNIETRSNGQITPHYSTRRGYQSATYSGSTHIFQAVEEFKGKDTNDHVIVSLSRQFLVGYHVWSSNSLTMFFLI